MKASFLDLRKRSRDILRALNRNEQVTVLYRGKPKAIMMPLDDEPSATTRADQHPAFGLWSDRKAQPSVDQLVRTLRKGRVDAL